MQPIYLSGAACAATLGGGLVALWLKAERARVIAFCSGALVAVAIMDLLPEALKLVLSSPGVFELHHLFFSCSVGFFFSYVLERSQDHARASAGFWGASGIGLHSFFDGFLIGQGFRAGDEIGWTVAFAVLLHKVTDGLSAVAVMLGTHQSFRAATIMLGATALAPILGVAAQTKVTLATPALGILLAFFSGILLYLGASHLLPEAREMDDSFWVPVMTLAGVAFISAVHLLSH